MYTVFLTVCIYETSGSEMTYNGQAFNCAIYDPSCDFGEDDPDVQKVKSLEIEAVRNAESGRFDEALNILNEVIEITPRRASLYNNRAQVYQLRGQLQDASDDLTKAIELGNDNQNRTLCQALCQRGLLHRKANRTELAREDFERAAKLGSHFAKSQLVELNPYAALCNQMLRKVMEELK